MEENIKATAVDNSPEAINERWYRPVNKVGRITMTIAIILSFAPTLYLYMTYGELPPTQTILAGLATLTSSFAAAWIIEPLSYFPALGTAGTYMGILSGNMSNQRVPAALVAKSVLDTEDGTQEAEIVATCGIAGSIYTNCIMTTLTAVAGAFILSILPEAIVSAITAYVLPTLFGYVSITNWLGRFSATNGLPHIHPHAFRHTVASTLIANGVDLVTTANELGHANATTTATIYAHQIVTAKAKASDVRSGIFAQWQRSEDENDSGS